MLTDAFKKHFIDKMSPLRQGKIYKLQEGQAAVFNRADATCFQGKFIQGDRFYVNTSIISVSGNLNLNFYSPGEQVNNFIFKLIKKFIEKEEEFLKNDKIVITSYDSVERIRKFFENLNRDVFVCSHEQFENISKHLTLVVRTEPTITNIDRGGYFHIVLWEDVGFFYNEKGN